MEPSKAAMKAALRVLTALSDRRQPEQADVDELHWYAPSDRTRPIDELVCDAIQRALKDREQRRRAVEAERRERVLNFVAAEILKTPAPVDMNRLIREHAERRQAYLALGARLKRIGIAFHAAAGIDVADSGSYSANLESAEQTLESVTGEITPGGITQLLEEYVRLSRRLMADEQLLNQHGIK